MTQCGKLYCVGMDKKKIVYKKETLYSVWDLLNTFSYITTTIFFLQLKQRVYDCNVQIKKKHFVTGDDNFTTGIHEYKN